MSTASKTQISTRSFLQLHDPDSISSNDVDPKRLRLRDAYERFLLPDLLDMAPSTRSEYRRSLNHWEKLTDDPYVCMISRETLREFRAKFIATGLASPTLNKTWRHLRAILRRLGPAADRNPWGEDIIEKIPAMRLASEAPKTPALIPPARIDTVYRACKLATWPERCTVSAAHCWQAMLVLLWNYGLRTQDILLITWGDVDFSGTGTIKYVAQKNKRKGGKFAQPRTLPMNETVKAHLWRIRKDDPQARVIDFPRRKHGLYWQWRVILMAAQVPLFDFRDLRETCNTRHEMRRQGVGKWILGHAATGINEKHYLNPTPLIKRAISTFPQPSAFLGLLNSQHQKLLFDR